ncbi:MAG: hypothetical protein LC791_09810 [Acidobacteria bacterium]|nr:hypothetical protein [Acidobacteriota bacterium]
MVDFELLRARQRGRVGWRLEFKSAKEIEALYRSRGVTPADDVLTYCQIGMRASHDLFTLALVGHDLQKLQNYYGSWEEWGNRADTPIQKK